MGKNSNESTKNSRNEREQIVDAKASTNLDLALIVEAERSARFPTWKS